VEQVRAELMLATEDSGKRGNQSDNVATGGCGKWDSKHTKNERVIDYFDFARTKYPKVENAVL
jgi:hypothetical protein